MTQDNDLIRLKRNWQQLTEKLKEIFGVEPDLQAVLFLIGVQELGLPLRSFSKEEKTDLIHIATCRILSGEGYYRYVKKDSEGWPHYEKVKAIPPMSLKEQDLLLRKAVLKYFESTGFFIPA
jgi:hypothetical protein